MLLGGCGRGLGVRLGPRRPHACGVWRHAVQRGSRPRAPVHAIFSIRIGPWRSASASAMPLACAADHGLGCRSRACIACIASASHRDLPPAADFLIWSASTQMRRVNCELRTAVREYTVNMKQGTGRSHTGLSHSSTRLQSGRLASLVDSHPHIQTVG